LKGNLREANPLMFHETMRTGICGHGRTEGDRRWGGAEDEALNRRPSSSATQQPLGNVGGAESASQERRSGIHRTGDAAAPARRPDRGEESEDSGAADGADMDSAEAEAGEENAGARKSVEGSHWWMGRIPTGPRLRSISDPAPSTCAPASLHNCTPGSYDSHGATAACSLPDHCGAFKSQRRPLPSPCTHCSGGD
jgi:hypothetical protein